MPVLEYLADTNSLRDFGRVPDVKAWFAAHAGQIALSAFTLAEMRRGVELLPEGKARRAAQQALDWAMQDYRDATLSFDAVAAAEWGRMTAEWRKQPLPLVDSFIGAIARANELKVVTRDLAGFRGCHRVNPHDGSEYPPDQASS